MAGIGNYYEATFIEILLRIRAFKKTEKEQWRRTRLIAWYCYGITAGENAKSMNEFLPLDDDKEDIIETEEDKMMAAYQRQLKWMDEQNKNYDQDELNKIKKYTETRKAS